MGMSAMTDSGFKLDQLKLIASQPERIIDDLVAVLMSLTSDDEETRAWAVDCIQSIESLPQSKADSIAGLCEHSSDAVVNWTCRLLGKAENVDAFQKQLTHVLLNQTCITARQTAAMALGCVQKASTETKQGLEVAAQNSDPRLQRLAKESLEKIG